MSEHVIGRLVHRPPPGRDLLLRLAFPCQPLRGEEPGLVSRDGHVAAYSDRPVVMNRKLNLVAFTDVQRPPDLLGLGVRFGSHLHPGADAGRRFDLGGRHPHGTSSPSSRIFRQSNSISQAGSVTNRSRPVPAAATAYASAHAPEQPDIPVFAIRPAQEQNGTVESRVSAVASDRHAARLEFQARVSRSPNTRSSRLGSLYGATALRSSSSGGGVKIPRLAPVK